MAENGVKTADDSEMADCDGEKVVTMMDVLQEQENFEQDANAVLGASDDKNCTYAKGYVKRQAIYACLTCCPEASTDATKRAGVCLACSLACHENHELVELYTKRNFRCDCGNPKFTQSCQFTPSKPDLNYDNKYNQNFSGIYCICKRPYPDPEATEEEDMIQCIVCEDWLHTKHLDATVPLNEDYDEMICKACMEDNDFLHDYSDLVVNVVDKEIIVTDPDLDISAIIQKKAQESLNKEKINGNVENSESKAVENKDIPDSINDLEDKNTTSTDVDMKEDENTEKATEISDTNEQEANTNPDASTQPTENVEQTTQNENVDGEESIASNKESNTPETMEKTADESKGTDDADLSMKSETENNAVETTNNAVESETTNNGVESETTNNGVESETTNNGVEAESITSKTIAPNSDKGDGSSEKSEENTSIMKDEGSSEVDTTNEKSAENPVTDNNEEKDGKQSLANGSTHEDNESPAKIKRKLSTEYKESSSKKAKLDEKPCTRPRGVKRVYKGATFWLSSLRQKLCTCNECVAMYKDLAVLFLTDMDDTVTAYEALGKANSEGTPSSQYEKGLQALSSLDRIQQINALTEYNKMRDKLLDFLKSFKDRKEIVKEEDIKAFFAGMKPKREPDGVYFCR